MSEFWEVFKNIGLGIFVNGAYAWQFTDQQFLGMLASFEGVFVMSISIYMKRRLK